MYSLVPAPNVFIQLNPVRLTFDPVTCVWLNRLALSAVQGLVSTTFQFQFFPAPETKIC